MKTTETPSGVYKRENNSRKWLFNCKREELRLKKGQRGNPEVSSSRSGVLGPGPVSPD